MHKIELDETVVENSGPQKLLVVDDDISITQILKLSLERQNYQVLSAFNGIEAIDMLQKHEDFTLVLTDIYMPKMSGLELLQYMKVNKPNTPVMMITGQPDVDIAVGCMKDGAVDYISKPFDLENIYHKIAKVIANSQQQPQATSSEESIDKIRKSLKFQLGSRYEIGDFIGEGSIGMVFDCKDLKKKDLPSQAIKIFKPKYIFLNEEERLRERFLASAIISSGIRHPNIVKIRDYGFLRNDDVPYLIMDKVEGKTLQEYIQGDEDFSVEEVIHIIAQAASALTVIHANEIIHRDIKPHNIMMTPEKQLKLCDFGVAHLPYELIGSPAYIAPEGFINSRVDHRADFFALGVTMYELLTGRRPFLGKTLTTYSHQVQFLTPDKPSEIMKGISPEIDKITMKLLAKLPEDRYQIAEDLLADLNNIYDPSSNLIESIP